MNASTVFFLLLVLACPLMMLFMKRSGHSSGARGHGGGCHGHGEEPRDLSADDLRRRREELDRLIEAREQSDSNLSERERDPRGGGGQLPPAVARRR